MESKTSRRLADDADQNRAAAMKARHQTSVLLTLIRVICVNLWLIVLVAYGLQSGTGVRGRHGDAEGCTTTRCALNTDMT